MLSKTCNICNESKALDQFSKDKTKPDGHQRRCKACDDAKTSAYRSDNPEKLTTRRAAYRSANRSKILAKDATYSQSPKGKFSKYKGGAKARNISFDLTLDQFVTFWQADCSYCGDPISTIGIDRIDNNVGYTLENCVACCARCNTFKMDYSQEETDAHMIKSLRHRGII